MIARLRSSLLPRIASATPRLLMSTRSFCPTCSRALYQAEPARDLLALWRAGVFPACSRSSVVQTLCDDLHMAGWPGDPAHGGAYHTLLVWVQGADDPRAFRKVVESDFRHAEIWLRHKSFGVTRDWLRRWRYRLLVHRASVPGEAAVFHMMHGSQVLSRARLNLSDTWVRHILWRRAQEAAPEVRALLGKDLLNMPVEALIARCWPWYEQMMLGRQLQQLLISGDRQDIVAIDGNAKLHLRTCGMPFCESIYCSELDKWILRDPHQRRTFGTIGCGGPCTVAMITGTCKSGSKVSPIAGNQRAPWMRSSSRPTSPSWQTAAFSKGAWVGSSCAREESERRGPSRDVFHGIV